MLDQPFFSRKQLNLIIVACVLAILWLSNSSSDETPAVIESRTLASVPLYIQRTELPISTNQHAEQGQQQPGVHTSLSFALPQDTPADHLDARLALRWLQQQLNAAAQTQQTTQPIHLSAQADRLIIRIPHLKVTDARTRLLFNTFSQLPDVPRWQAAQQRLLAERYLDEGEMSQAERWLTQQLRPYSYRPPRDFSAWRDFYQQLFSRAQLHLAVLGEPDEDWLDSLQQQLQTLSSGQRWADNPARKPIPQQRDFELEQVNQPAYIAQLGRILPGLSAPDFPQFQAALAEIKRSAEELGIACQWQLSGPQSQLRLAAYSEQAITPEQLLGRLHSLIEQRSNGELDTLISGLIDNIEAADDSLEQQWRLLENLAFYQLPTDFQRQQLHTLKQLDADTLRRRSLALLEPGAYLQAQEHP